MSNFDVMVLAALICALIVTPAWLGAVLGFVVSLLTFAVCDLIGYGLKRFF